MAVALHHVQLPVCPSELRVLAAAAAAVRVYSCCDAASTLTFCAVLEQNRPSGVKLGFQLEVGRCARTYRRDQDGPDGGRQEVEPLHTAAADGLAAAACASMQPPAA